MTGDFEAQYRARTPNSYRLYEEANRYLPSGVAGNGKFLKPYPIYVQDAHGSKVWDKDGNQYIDLLMGSGVHILGHSPEPVIRAVQDQLAHGTHLYMPAEFEVRLAEKICKHMPYIEKVRFVNSGTEATMMALRAARAYRRRDLVAKFEGNYHGQHDTVLISTIGTNGGDEVPGAHIDCVGIPQMVPQDMLILPFNDADYTVSKITEHAEELGAVIIEPVSAFGLGCVAAEPDFLQALREVTSEHDIPLIFDEVVTNFRLGLGGAGEYFGVRPDLVCLGKIIGGGFPVGGFGGREDIMDKVVATTSGVWDLTEQIFQSGTFSGNPISMVAGLAVIEELEKLDLYQDLDQKTAQLKSAIVEIGEEFSFELLVTGVSSFFQIHFGVDEIRNKRDAQKEDKTLSDMFHLGLRANGIMANSHPLFLSSAHSEEDLQLILETTGKVLSQMKPNH
jgi:glutamate-1-semialdehyde 2,1-aminomutase